MTYHPPCTECGWKFPGFHVCLKKTPEEMKREESIKAPKHIGKGTNSQQGRWIEDRASKKERDEEIVLLYRVHKLGVQAVADKVGVSKPVAHRVLQEAVARGELTMRGRGGHVKRKDYRDGQPVG